MTVFTALVLITAICNIWCGCPAPALISPCVCKDNSISCGGNSSIDLVGIFEKLDNNLNKSDKSFKVFNLTNTAINEIKANTFKRITFDTIDIHGCDNLTKIDVKAFAQTDLVTKHLEIRNNLRLSSPDNSIFDLLTRFINLEYLNILNNNITEIPDKAFQTNVGYQDKLKTLILGGISIIKIGNNAFTSLESLTRVEVFNTSIETIPEFAFAFEQASNETLELKLVQNDKLSSSKFNESFLDHFKRPVTLKIGNNMDYFSNHENVLLKFLNSNKENKIDFKYITRLDCNDCKYYWLKKNPGLIKQTINLNCVSGKNFTDPDNFAECGANQYLKPCTLVRNQIQCGGTTAFDLNGVLSNFSQQLSDNGKHFNSFYLSNTAIKELVDNVFDEITFDKIYIDGCSSLKQIQRDAFSSNNMFTKEITIYNNPVLSSTNNNSIFKILSSFPSIEEISLYNNDLFTEIPSNAFQPINGYQNNLRKLYLQNSFTKIGSNSFYNLNNLTLLSFYNARFKSIPDNAFAFKHKSNVKLSIDFTENPYINSSVFSEKSLININRPTNISFGDYRYKKQITYLDEKVFLPFLMDNENNSIDLKYEDFDCNDCRNYWLKKQPKLVPRLFNTKCSNGKVILDPVNFKNCSTNVMIE